MTKKAESKDVDETTTDETATGSGRLKAANSSDVYEPPQDGDPNPNAFMDPDADPKGHLLDQLRAWGRSQEPVSWAPNHLQPVIGAIRAANAGFGESGAVQAMLDQQYPGDELTAADVLSVETDGGTVTTAFTDIDPQYLGEPVYANEDGLVSKQGTFTPSGPDPEAPPASRSSV